MELSSRSQTTKANVLLPDTDIITKTTSSSRLIPLTTPRFCSWISHHSLRTRQHWRSKPITRIDKHSNRRLLHS